MQNVKQIVIVDLGVTPDTLSSYEKAKIISTRIEDVGNGELFNLSIEEMKISATDYNKKVNSTNKERLREDGKTYILEDDSKELAEIELNCRKTPYLIFRKIKETDTHVYAELIDPNKLIH